MLIRTLVALTLVAPIAAHAIPIPAERPATCPGPSLEQVVTDVGPADRYTFTGPMMGPFMSLLANGRHSPLPAPPDAVTLMARPERPVVVLFTFHGCALALIEAARHEVYDALRAGIGPVVSLPLPGEPA